MFNKSFKMFSYLGSGALPGKILLVRFIRKITLLLILGQVRLSKG